MTNVLIRLFIHDPDNLREPAVRSSYGALAGGVGIVLNLLLCLGKLLIGILAGSVSITADAVNNLSDASSSIVTMVGFYLSKKPEDQEHPFGHARIEYLCGLAVAIMILFIGLQMGREAVIKILHPTAVAFSPALVTVLLVSILGKLWMSLFNKEVSRRIDSASLLATAADCRNDMISTGAVLISVVISHATGWMLDGYIGLLVALFVLWSGIGIARDTVDLLLGGPADDEMKETVRREVLNGHEKILGIHDLMVHDYGPGQKFASIHVEVDRREDVMEIHNIIDNIERDMLKHHRIHLTVHYDPIVVDDPRTDRIRETVVEKLLERDPRLSLHDFRMVEGPLHTNLIFDVVLPYDLCGQEEALQQELEAAIQEPDTRYYTVITFDHEC